MSFLRQLVGTALNIAALVTGAGWLFAAAIAVNSYDARREGKKAERAARDAYNASLKDRQVMLDITPDAPRTLVLGRVRTVEGIRRRFSSGTNREKLVMVVSFAGHEIDAFETFYFNDQALTLDGNGYVQTAPYFRGSTVSEGQQFTLNGSGSGSFTVAGPIVAGSVTAFEQENTGEAGWLNTAQLTASGSGTTITVSGGTPGALIMVNWVRSLGASLARIRAYTGTAGQNVGAVLAAEYPGAPITSSDRFAGIAVAIVELTYDPDAYPGGLPNVTALVRGARVFDPRTSTTAWSENPALHAYHYARHANGWGVPDAEIRTADVIAAANACDVSTTFTQRFPDNSTATVTLPRHRCGIVIALDSDPRAAMEDIMAAMAGRWGWAGGTLRMRAGTMAAPVWEINEGVLAYRLDENGQVGDEPVLRATNGVPREQRVTRVTGVCTMPAERWQVLPFPAVQDPVLIARDGFPLPLEVRYAGVNHPAHAQHLGTIRIREAQAGLRMDLLCNVSAWRLELFDVGELELPRLGMADKTMEVIGWRWSPGTGVQVQLAEITAAMFSPVAELTGMDPAPNSSLPPPWQVPAITGLALSSDIQVREDGAVDVTVAVTWAAITDNTILQGGWVEVEWRYADVDGEAAVVRADTLSGHALRALQPARAVVVRVRAVNGLPVRGPWTLPVTLLTQGDTLAPDAPTGLAAVAVVGGLRVTWAASLARDYLETELRYGPSSGATWAGGTRVYIGSGTSHTWIPPSDADYTLLLRHRDRSRNDSSTATLNTSYLTVAGAAVLRLLQDRSAFIFEDENAATSGSPPVTLQALLYGVTGTATFAAQAFNSAGSSLGTVTLGGTGNTRTLSAAQFVTYSGTAWVRVTATLGTLQDQVTVLRADQGSSAVQALLSNESHTVPADSAGVVTSYALSGTDITVTEGATQLAYNGVGTTAGTWAVSASGSSITPGFIGGSGLSAYTTAASGMTDDAAAITFTITGRTLTGAGFAITKVQSFAKSRAGAQGPAGSPGQPGAKTATPTVYQWALTIPTIAGTSTYTWASAEISPVPSGWSLDAGAGSAGQTLWGAAVPIQAAGTATQSSVDWSAASITARGFNGASGSGARRAYTLTTAASLGSGTVTTTGSASLPGVSTVFGTGLTWAASPSTPGVGQTLYQSDGLYNPTTNQIVWETPYISALKVGNLAAIAVNTGSLTVNDRIAVSGAGYIAGGAFTAYAWPSSGTGFWLGPNGLLLGNQNTGGYFQVTSDGSLYAPGLSIVGGSATFAGSLSAASGSLGSLNIASGGHVRSGQTAYNTGVGFFLEGGSSARFSIGNAAGSRFLWDGSAISISGPIINDPVLNNPQLPAFNAGISGSGGSFVGNGRVTNAYSASGFATGSWQSPAIFNWEVSTYYPYGNGTVGISGGVNGSSVTLESTGNNSYNVAYLTLRLTDAGGRTASATREVVIYHGSPGPIP